MRPVLSVENGSSSSATSSPAGELSRWTRKVAPSARMRISKLQRRDAVEARRLRAAVPRVVWCGSSSSVSVGPASLDAWLTPLGPPRADESIQRWITSIRHRGPRKRRLRRSPRRRRSEHNPGCSDLLDFRRRPRKIEDHLRHVSLATAPRIRDGRVRCGAPACHGHRGAPRSRSTDEVIGERSVGARRADPLRARRRPSTSGASRLAIRSAAGRSPGHGGLFASLPFLAAATMPPLGMVKRLAAARSVDHRDVRGDHGDEPLLWWLLVPRLPVHSRSAVTFARFLCFVLMPALYVWLCTRRVSVAISARARSARRLRG